ncbi:uncharacterized protein Z519_02270 [Cladophialophora bantiana CBS 173.52]|uniref:ATPase AAA-type core domain-containing protein n=1 Tax=Cladophialophora bantiana (strain ATCC 10958 / CBS 173.52 / CDC B-1940 / NIH 8579) TaxID=1442370 RepID=A0A0D2IJD0_CLAB1|nr:uncharacterized protein Z519_02270 [Cladophialophora bantiana CBS 173.52]KIW96879.1 hypothetical protein Z519_02270 [Cladophialophora bantiana CBS 173.52]
MFCQKDTDLASPTSEEMAIIQDGLTDAFEDLVSHDVENRSWDVESDLSASYDCFYHCHQRIRDLVDLNGQKQTGYSIKVLSRTRASAKLFRPGEVIIRNLDGVPHAYMVEEVEWRYDDQITHSSWTLEFDGRFRRQHIRIVVDGIGEDDDAVAVKSMEALPLRLDKDGLHDHLEKEAPRESQILGRRGSHRTLHPDRYLEYRVDGHEDVDMLKKEPSTGAFRLLMPAKIPGFAFHDKKWRSLQVDFIRPVRCNENAFNHLVLKANKKELNQALVTVPLENNQATGVIEGKGVGLIMLLHGPPGTGKTLTAETVAELANKPLYRFTYVNIGAEAEGVEKYRESALYL